MRIAFVLPGYPWRPVGGFRVVYEYANGLVARGHDVSVVHPRRLANDIPTTTPRRLLRLRLQAGRLRNLIMRPVVRWAPIDERVRMLYVPEPLPRYVPDGDAVFATAWQTAEYVGAYPEGKGDRCYLVQSYEVWSGPRERVDATWRAPLKKVVIARWLYEKGLELGVAADQMMHVPNGINHARYRIVLPIEERRPQVAMLYSPLGCKASEDGIRALELARRRVPQIQARLFGTGPRPKDLPRWIDYFRDPAQTRLIENIYNGSSIYLCSSLAEGWALPPAEAMACGCALVSTDIGGVRDYAQHEVTALLSPPGNPEKLAAALIRSLTDERLRTGIARSGNECIKGFTWERSTDLLEQFLEQEERHGITPGRISRLQREDE
ncbi:MAG: glycosyltransferase family 4 protein [Candidatus Eisenbacteria bacterium]